MEAPRPPPSVEPPKEDSEKPAQATPKRNEGQFGPWTFCSIQSHIIQSKCSQPDICKTTKDATNPSSSTNSAEMLCTFCQFEQHLTIPQFPDMVFADNVLSIKHSKGCGIKFDCLHALQLVDDKNDLMKVAIAEEWKEARAEDSNIHKVVKPYDWTYTTSYKGTLTGSPQFKVTQTNEKIDIESLKKKEKILFYDDIHLFEDELADNGCAQLTVKIRVMPSSFFVLQRFYLRVDGILVRVYDTRLYHKFGTDYLIREFSRRGQSLNQLNLPINVIIEPNEIWMHLPVLEEITEKLEIPS